MRSESNRRGGDSGAMPVQEGGTYVRHIKDMPVFDGTRTKFAAWKGDFLYLAKLRGLFKIFTEGVGIPVADEGISFLVLQQTFPIENILSRNLARYYAGWDTLRHVASPVAGWRVLVDTHAVSTL